MRHLSHTVGLLVITVHLFSAQTVAFCAQTAAVAEPKSDSGAKPNTTLASVTGTLLCAHCDLGIGDECCAALQIENTAVILEGKANDQLIDVRLNGGIYQVLGTLRVFDGNLHLRGLQQTKLAKPPPQQVSVTGRVMRSGSTTHLQNGKQNIRVRGPKVKTLDKYHGKWVQISGSLKVDRRGRIQVTVLTAKPTTRPPQLIRSRRKAKPSSPP